MSSNARNWLSTSDIANIAGISSRHVYRAIKAIPGRIAKSHSGRARWVLFRSFETAFCDGYIAGHGKNHRFLDTPTLRFWCKEIGLRARGISHEAHLIATFAEYAATGRELFNEPDALRKIAECERTDPCGVRKKRHAARLAAARVQMIYKDWSGKETIPLSIDKTGQVKILTRELGPEGLAFCLACREMLEGKYLPGVEEAAERQRSGGERREALWRKMEECDYVAEVAGN